MKLKLSNDTYLAEEMLCLAVGEGVGDVAVGQAHPRGLGAGPEPGEVDEGQFGGHLHSSGVRSELRYILPDDRIHNSCAFVGRGVMVAAQGYSNVLQVNFVITRFLGYSDTTEKSHNVSCCHLISKK